MDNNIDSNPRSLSSFSYNPKFLQSSKYMAEVHPVGSRYQPTDSELLQCLLCKAHGEPFPAVDLARECDLYSGVEPMELFRETDNNVLYFFTKLKKRKKNKGRAGKGTWKGVTKEDVYGVNGKYRGYKKSFVYETKEKGKIRYNMDEYSLDSSSLLRAKVSWINFIIFEFFFFTSLLI